MGQRFYIQYQGDYAFDYMLWWRPDSKGYTYDIRQAGLYTEAEARSICGIRGEEAAWPEEAMRDGIESAVSIEKLQKAGHKPQFALKPADRRKRKKFKKQIHCESKVCQAWKDLALARSDLLVCYRIGKPPSDALMRKLARLNELTRGGLAAGPRNDKAENPD